MHRIRGMLIAATWMMSAVATRGAESSPVTSGTTVTVIRTTVTLLNGIDLTGWTPVLKHPQTDPAQIWTVEAGELRCSGGEPGYLRTNAVYADYALELEWRWTAAPGNSGVLLHVAPPDTVWPRSIEAQLQHQRAGDVWLIGGSVCSEAGTPSDPQKPAHHVPRVGLSAENPAGEWNRYHIICRGDTVQIVINGRPVNTLTGCSPAAGSIALQSEGAPIAFRRIRLLPL